MGTAPDRLVGAGGELVAPAPQTRRRLFFGVGFSGHDYGQYHLLFVFDFVGVRLHEWEVVGYWLWVRWNEL